VGWVDEDGGFGEEGHIAGAGKGIGAWGIGDLAAGKGICAWRMAVPAAGKGRWIWMGSLPAARDAMGSGKEAFGGAGMRMGTVGEAIPATGEGLALVRAQGGAGGTWVGGIEMTLGEPGSGLGGMTSLAAGFEGRVRFPWPNGWLPGNVVGSVWGTSTLSSRGGPSRCPRSCMKSLSSCSAMPRSWRPIF
jgi:hypothetical protein